MIDPIDRRLFGTHDFREVDCVLDVAQGALRFVFGIGLEGPGRAWVGMASFEQVGTDVPVSPHVTN